MKKDKECYSYKSRDFSMSFEVPNQKIINPRHPIILKEIKYPSYKIK